MEQLATQGSPEPGASIEPLAAPAQNATFADQRSVTVSPLVLSNARATRTRGAILPTDVGYYVEARGHYCSRPGGATQDTIIYCTGGRGWCRVGGQALAIGAGELLVIPAGAPHAYGADEKLPWSIYWFHAEGALTEEYLEALGVLGGPPIISLEQDPKLVALFVELIEALQEGHDPEQLRYGSNVSAHLLSVMVRCQRQASRLVPDAAQRVSASIEFMTHNLAHSLDIAQLSRMARLSPSHYSALFKRQTGRSPLDYFLQLRMQLGAGLLDTTNLSVKAIAMRLGYKDALYFTRVFTGVHGMSPTEYRRRQQPIQSSCRSAGTAIGSWPSAAMNSSVTNRTVQFAGSAGVVPVPTSAIATPDR